MSGKDFRHIIEEIKDRCDIVDVISAYIPLKKAGSSFKALCPFHKEKTPSFYVNPRLNIYHCFGCGAGGDVIKFIMEYEKADFMSAVRLLASRYGIKLNFDYGSSKGGVSLLYEINDAAAKFFHGCLFFDAGKKAREYLSSRSLSRDIIERFLIGYAPPQFDSLIRWAKNKYSVEILEQAGLVVKDYSGQKIRYFDRFRDRIMFALRNEYGMIAGFSGRRLSDAEEGGKYINTPETIIFKKSKLLYGLYEARENINKKGRAIVCEGQIDVIRCHEYGLGEAVAPLGIAFTEEHANLLRRYTDTVIIIFDGDEAGSHAAIRTAEEIIRSGCGVRIVMLDKGEDPDSFLLKYGVEKMEDKIKTADSFVSFYVKLLRSTVDLKSDIGSSTAARKIIQSIVMCPDPLMIDKMLEELADALAVRPDSIRDMARGEKRTIFYKRERSIGRVAVTDPAFELCVHLVRLDSSDRLIEDVRKYLPLDFIKDEKARLMIKAILDSSEKKMDLVKVVDLLDNEERELSSYFAKVLSAPEKVSKEDREKIEKSIHDLILSFWRKHLQEEIRKLKEKKEGLTQSEIEYRQKLIVESKIMNTWERAVSYLENYL